MVREIEPMTTPNYSDTVLDHFYHCRGVGTLPDSDTNVVVGKAGSEAGGELLKLYLRVVNHTVIDAKFQAYGCCATIAVGSWLVEYCLNKQVDTLKQLTSQMITEALSLSKIRKQAALLGEDALKSALSEANR